MLTAVIIEDEIPASMRMRKLITAFPNRLALLGEADSGKTAIDLIEKKRPAVVFLDIQLPDMSGFEVLAQLSYQPWIVFTTAYAEHAIKAFEQNSADYLVKPFSKERFENALLKLEKIMTKAAPFDFTQLAAAMQQMQPPKRRYSLPVKKRDKIILLDFEDIAYLKAEDKYVQAITAEGQNYLLSKSISKLLEELPEQFIRVHRSYIVNQHFIQEIKKHFKGNLVLVLKDKAKTSITTGGTYSQEVKRLIL